MTPKEELELALAELRSPDPRQRVIMMDVLLDETEPEAELLPAVEALLADETPTVLSLPISVGEVRWLAAHTLAWLRRQRGIAERVRLSGVPRPVPAGRLEGLLERASLPRSKGKGGGVNASLDEYARLVACGAIERVDLDLGPEDVAFGRRSLMY